MFRISRFAGAALAFCLVCGGAAAASSEELIKHHALSLVGEPKYGPDFDHFGWVNPDAPKGGRIRLWAFGSFDTLNQFADAKGRPAANLELIYDRLMTSSPDEPATAYANVAEWVSFPADYSSATVGLRSTARFHDGKPMTPEDVIFSFNTLKKVSGRLGRYYANVIKAEQTGPLEVKFTFNVQGNRELPLIICELPVLPKHYWQGIGANGEPRDLSKSTLEIPLGSGPYRIKEMAAGRFITYERVSDWWGKDLPANKGQNNIDEIKYNYGSDKSAAFNEFKAGDFDFWPEGSAKDWATAFDFDAVNRGLVIKYEAPIQRIQSMQAFAFNTRRPQFKDPRVRQAFNYVLNFEEANKTLFFDQYTRSHSYFGNSELEAKGLPEGRELELLNEVKDLVPPALFTQEWKNPQYAWPNDSIDERQKLSEAFKLLAAAGWKLKGNALVNEQGEQLAAEFLISNPDFVRIAQPYAKKLEDKLGIKASVRIVDTSQYQRRVDTFDFDIIVETFAQSYSPGNEQRSYWGSAAADQDGSDNVIGIKNPAVDKLIDKIILAKDRADLVAATRALDRVLLWNHYVVPQWGAKFDRFAVWSKFGKPDKLPSQTISFPRVWWYDDAAARKLAEARSQ
jgi:microcin C transport system substrate-binding protein